MSPKEKAKELYDKSLPLAHDWEAHNKIIAKKIALFCVEEIKTQEKNSGVISVKAYWKKVEEEIEKL